MLHRVTETAKGESYVDRLPRPLPYNFHDRIVKILMIAPEPFFEPRGTPFSEYHRIRALLELGHTVDLVTYPFGRDVSLPGLRVFRCAAAAVRERRSGSGRRGEDSARSRLSLHRAAPRAVGALRRRALARGRQLVSACCIAAMLRRAASLRHALEPAAAARRTSRSAARGC